MKRLPLLLTFLLSLASRVPTPVYAANDLQQRVEAYAKPLVQSGYLSGCLVVSRNDTTLAHACFGYEDAARRVLNGSDTRFCVASLTKPITVVAVLRLVEDGRLRLDQPVSTWVDEFPSGDSISVADLLTHAAGVPHRVTTPEEEEQRLTPKDIVERVKAGGLLFPPGSRREYSSAGYTVIAYIMEQVTGSSYGDAMQALVFEPLGMKDTFHPDGRPISHAATSFVAGANGPVAAPRKDYAFLAGAGSLYSTSDDMARFARAFLHRELLAASSWQAFHDLGWGTSTVVQWSGSTNGFASWLDIHKDDGSIFAFTGNAGTGACNFLRRALPGLMAGEEVAPAPPAPAAVRLTAEQMRGLEGAYTRSNGAPYTVELRDGVLFMLSDAVYPIGVDRFFNPTYFSEAVFERGADGRASVIRITAPGLDNPLVFERN